MFYYCKSRELTGNKPLWTSESIKTSRSKSALLLEKITSRILRLMTSTSQTALLVGHFHFHFHAHSYSYQTLDLLNSPRTQSTTLNPFKLLKHFYPQFTTTRTPLKHFYSQFTTTRTRENAHSRTDCAATTTVRRTTTLNGTDRTARLPAYLPARLTTTLLTTT